MKDKIKNLFKFIIIFIFLIITYFISLFLVSLIPSSYIKENVSQSADYLLEKTEIETIDFGIRNVYLFQFTNSLMINTAYSIDSDNPIEAMLTAKKNYIPGVTTIINQNTPNDLQSAKKYYKDGIITTDAYQSQELYDTVNENDLFESFEYARYWHGYLVYLRLLLLILNYKQITVILFIIVVTLLGLNFYYMWKKVGIKYAIALLISYLAVDSLVVSKSINEITCFIISLIVNLIILIKNNKIKNIPLMFFVLGSLVNFFDFFTNPIVTYGMPILIYILLIKKEKDFGYKEALLLFFKTGIAWCTGFSLTWISKWIITDCILDRNVLKNAIEQIIYRTTGTNSYGFIDDQMDKGYYSIFVMLFSKYSILVAYFLLYIILIYQRLKKDTTEKNNFIEFIFSIPLIYYFVIIILNFISNIIINKISYINVTVNMIFSVIYNYTLNGGIGIIKSIGLFIIKSMFVLINIAILIEKFEIKHVRDIKKMMIVFPYIIGFFIPIVWFIVLKNHSIIHSFFSYRNLIISIFSYEVILIEEKNNNEIDDKN